MVERSPGKGLRFDSAVNIHPHREDKFFDMLEVNVP